MLQYLFCAGGSIRGEREGGIKDKRGESMWRLLKLATIKAIIILICLIIYIYITNYKR